MKKIISVIISVLILLTCFASCSVNTKKIKSGDAVIGILTPAAAAGDEYAEAMKMQETYGADKVVVETFDVGYGSSTASIYEAAERLLENHNVKAIIVARGVEGTADAIKAVKSARPDIECIDVNPSEIDYYVTNTADLAVSMGSKETCAAMVERAKKQGIKTVVYLVPSQYSKNISIQKTGDALKTACDDRGVDYVQHDYQCNINPIDQIKLSAKAAVKSCIEKYGKDTAFYSASCVATDTVINAAAENEAGFIYGLCSCPENHYKTAFGAEKGESYEQLLENLREAVDGNARKKLCVIESSPVSIMIKIAMGYAIAYCNGSIDAEAAFDEKVFKSAIQSALNGESVDDIEFAVSEKYGNMVNVGFPVETL
ncbi:MAG: DUF3798 domain-containing protein [Clostridia bacterium]|nr:DUF3798 domain-containing protein [Clostridia bacterium]